MIIEKAATWRKSLNLRINEEITEILKFPNVGGWSENYITARILIALGKSGSELYWAQRGLAVKWAGFKLNGPAETDYGDIAVVVEVLRPAAEPIVGFAYYEAKRMYYQKDKPDGYKKLNDGQLAKMLKSSPANSVLLYHKESRIGTQVISMGLAQKMLQKGVGIKNANAMLRHCQPFEWRISENLQGLNLDFSFASVDDVLAKINESAEKPYVLIAKLKNGPDLANEVIASPKDATPLEVVAKNLRASLLGEDSSEDLDNLTQRTNKFTI